MIKLLRLRIPVSLIFFVVTAIVFLLQVIPITGVFLMFALAMVWSIILVNAGMIGVALEAGLGRVSRWWLLLPLAFYGGYWVVAAHDHRMLRSLAASYDAANARIAIPFDPTRQSLVFNSGESGAWLTQNYALPVAYSANANFPEGYLSHRMMKTAICAKVRQLPALQAAFVHAYGFHDGDAIGARRMETRFCDLSMPERPALPLMQVSRREEKITEGWLPVTRVTTRVTTPDGQIFQLLGGVAAPLSWIPKPVMGCALNSGSASWDCGASFWREGFTPIVSGTTRYSRDSTVLARALGLHPVPIANRKGCDPALVLAKMATVEGDTLTRQLANIDAMIADPVAKVADWQIGVVTNNAEALASRADAIMSGIERAARVTGKDRYRARESGRILARLIANLPHDKFVAFGARVLALYSNADDKHWLWEAEPLLRRLGDLGTDALPYLINARASTPSVNSAGIEGLCRVGVAGRSVGEPALLAMWAKSRDGFDRNNRAAMYIAMRRMGISPPPLVDGKHDQLASLQAEWADISPQSPPTVCAIDDERRARRQRNKAGRGSNLN
jgi:hypothetical protein